MQFFFVIMQSYLDDGSTRDPWLAKKRFLPPLSTCLGDDATYPCRISLVEANLELHRHLPILAHSVTVKDRWILDNCTLFFLFFGNDGLPYVGSLPRVCPLSLAYSKLGDLESEKFTHVPTKRAVDAGPCPKDERGDDDLGLASAKVFGCLD
jgi:hypothetical protein